MPRRLLLVCLLLVGCRETVEVDLSGLSKELLNLFGSPYAVSLPLYVLAEYDLPTFANGRYVLEPNDLCQRMPNETTNTWTWLNGTEITFGSIVDMHSIPTLSKHPPGNLTVEDLQVCDVGEDYCVEFRVDGLSRYRRGVTFYRVDLLVQKAGRWYFVWGGYPVMDWRGYRALWFVGWVDKEDVERLMDDDEEVLLLIKVKDFPTGEQRKGIIEWKKGGGK